MAADFRNYGLTAMSTTSRVLFASANNVSPVRKLAEGYCFKQAVLRLYPRLRGAYLRAIARPMPRLAPVMKITLPFKDI